MSTISANQRSSTNYLSFILSGISISFLSDVNHQREPMIFNQLSFFHIIWYFYFFLVRCQPSVRTNNLQLSFFHIIWYFNLSDVNHQCEPMIFNQLSFFHILWYFNLSDVNHQCEPMIFNQLFS